MALKGTGSFTTYTDLTWPTATTTTVGGIKVGANLSIDASGTLSASGGSGSGDVIGPSSAVAGHFATISADGKHIYDGGVSAASFATVGALSSYVPVTTTVNSKALSGNITLSASDVSAVPTTRTINSKALSADITLTPSDIGAESSFATLPINKGGTGKSTAPTTGQLLIGKTDGTYALSTLTQGSNVTITSGDGTITIAATGGSGGGGITWNEVTSSSVSLAVDNGYISNYATLMTATLPSTCAVGKVIRLSGLGAGGWKIAQNASQYIRFGQAVSTTGTGGYVASTDQYDSVELLCVVANVGFKVISHEGVLEVA